MTDNLTNNATDGTLEKSAPKRAWWDVALTILLLLLNSAIYLFGGAITSTAVIFTDFCPNGCNTEAGFSAVVISAAIVSVVGTVLVILSIVRLVRGRRGWWVAAILVVFTLVGWWLTVNAYTIFVGVGPVQL